MVLIFLGVLELVKELVIVLLQDQPFGDIKIVGKEKNL
jgi:chromatin segregation and condensation protein Rec8/ScpA/Scc1 (kleisin family)